MQKTSNKKVKFFFLGFLILIFVSLFMAIYFMTPYANVHVFFSYGGVYSAETEFEIGNLHETNELLYNFMKSTKVVNKPDFEMNADMIYNFQVNASNYNNILIISFVVSLVVYGLLILFANNKRRIFYKSNLVGGIFIPLITVGFSVFTAINGVVLLSDFMTNQNAYKAAALMQDTEYNSLYKRFIINGNTYKGYKYTWDDVLSNTTQVNSLSIILSIVVQVLLIAYAIAIMTYSIIKYKKTAEERKSIIERAESANV